MSDNRSEIITIPEADSLAVIGDDVGHLALAAVQAEESNRKYDGLDHGTDFDEEIDFGDGFIHERGYN